MQFTIHQLVRKMKMKNIIPFSFFFFVTIFPQQTLQSSSSPADTLINRTCKQCADGSPVFSYAFCAAALRSVPVGGAVTNLQGLALLATELAFANASAAILAVDQALIAAAAADDPVSLACLRDCRQLYSDARAATLGAAAKAFLRERYEDATALMSAAMEAPETCREGFREMGREVVPPQLKKANYDLFQLCDIALCVGNLLASFVHEY